LRIDRRRGWNAGPVPHLISIAIEQIERKGGVMSQEKPNSDPREKTDKKSFKQTDKPWEQPVEKEQNPKSVPKQDLENWHESNTH
jgi:hypothetical protein